MAWKQGSFWFTLIALFFCADATQHRDHQAKSGKLQVTKEGQFIPEISAECKKIGICTDVANYPKEHVNKLIAELGPAANKFYVEKLSPGVYPTLNYSENIELCDFRRNIVIPSAARNRANLWRFILNDRNKPLQGFKTETCTKDSCMTDLITVSYGYESMCKQNFQYRVMAGLDSNGEMIEELFQVPSCCYCVLKKV